MIWTKEGRLESVRKVGELMGLTDVVNEGLNLLCVSLLQRISGLKGVIRAKDGGVKSVGEVWESMGLSDMLS